MSTLENKIDRVVGTVLMLVALVAASALFFSGFRFLNPLDTISRFVLGGAAMVGSGAWLWTTYHRHV